MSLNLNIEGSSPSAGTGVGTIGRFSYTGVISFFWSVDLRRVDGYLSGDESVEERSNGNFTSTAGGCPSSGLWFESSQVNVVLNFSDDDEQLRVLVSVGGSEFPLTQSPPFDPECIDSLTTNVWAVLTDIDWNQIALPVTGGSVPLSGTSAAFLITYSGMLHVGLSCRNCP